MQSAPVKSSRMPGCRSACLTCSVVVTASYSAPMESAAHVNVELTLETKEETTPEETEPG